MFGKTLAVGVLVAGSAVGTVQAEQLGAFWRFNNNSANNPVTGASTNSYYHQTTDNDPYNDGFWSQSLDALFPITDTYDGNPGVLAGPEGSTTPAQFGAWVDVSGLVGSNGVSGDTQNNNWLSFAGTSTAGSIQGPDASIYGGGSLAITGSGNNGSYFDVMIDDLFNAPTGEQWSISEISWAQRGTSTGFNQRKIQAILRDGSLVDYAIENASLSSSWTGEYIDFQTGAASYTGIGVALSDVVGVRFILDGASSTNGNNRIDNIGINVESSLIPEPASLALLGLGGLAILLRRRDG